MATAKKKGYPLLPIKHWWALREKFRKSIPGTVSTNYLASVLGMTERSAQNNVLPSLRTMKLVDDDGKPTDLATKWRDDGQYPKVCSSILKAVYPQELIDIGSGSSANKDAITRWFANHTAAGDNAVRKMTAMYLTLCEADPTKAKQASPSTSAKTKTDKPAAATKKQSKAAASPPVGKGESAGSSPALHINVQVHISSDATPEQIDQIFASMAKHLYGNN